MREGVRGKMSEGAGSAGFVQYGMLESDKINISK